MQGFVPPPRILLETARRLGAHPAYHVRDANAWQGTSWQDYGQAVRQAARALLQLGVQRGDAVAILGFNSPQWATMAFAAMAIGATPAGIYWTSSSQDIAYILNHCRASVLLVDDSKRLRSVEEVSPELLHLNTVVMLSSMEQVGNSVESRAKLSH